MTLPVFIDPDITHPGEHGELTAPAAVAHHVVTVRRMQPGDELQLSDGAGLRITGSITSAARDGLRVAISDVTVEDPASPQLVLVQALAKSGRDLAAVEAAVEVGVDAVIPWEAQRSIVRWPAAKAGKSIAKWRHTSAAAAEQSRRAFVPAIGDLVRGSGLAHAFTDADAVFVLHEDGSQPLTAQLRTLADRLAAAPNGIERIVLVVGPEGGISEAEVSALTAAGAQTAVLGASVLRASTAGPVALGLCQAALGRW
ncbi:16S rRNA (uracil(1498)-N(3))-methyltransferase [Brevibacterium luteolum]|uniref:Ribosomal RNA small subunit methyltransferase E n=1 Tax=Brevibacterium luteolum TaxID=199591 RepID=A0A6G8KU19_9MICO|nr:16S rRNA (uracil(1498)-N(3))-methyltransferase [Brevibacterium luteolum]QIN28268.1 16S rRNA (uracil(1498)-N(3))-methyltransferase [Brevibacterium luteolum]